MINNIISKDNPKIKEIVKIRDDKKYRDQNSLYYVEGERIINDTSHDIIKNLFICDSCKDKFKYIIDKIDNEKIYILSDEAFNKIKDTVNSQGIVAIVKSNLIKTLSSDFLSKIKFIIILDNIQNPGNLGTIIRVAEASGVSLVILSNDCCDIYNTKVIRAGMSSISRMNIYASNDLSKDIDFLKDNNFKIYSTVLNDNSVYYNKVKYNNKTALIIGNEGNGIKKEIINQSDANIIIPMKGNIESLNASIATSIICYEVFNQIF